MTAILGIWDGHDAGTAMVAGPAIVSAINEERLTRRKLEVGFPRLSLAKVLEQGGIFPSKIEAVAFSTSDFAKTLTRAIPALKESYYKTRRRKTDRGVLYGPKKMVKYKLTELPSCFLTKALSHVLIKHELNKFGLGSVPLELVDHHTAHACTAAFCSGFPEALVLTIDGIGDGLSGSLWSFKNRKLTLLRGIPGTCSLGIFFEHVTNLMNMRELEDEGKVMALANYAFPVSDEKNPMLQLFHVQGTELRCRYGSIGMYRELSRLFWRFPSEQFAYMAQRTLEVKLVQLIRNALKATGHSTLAYAGGVASNVKVNMLIRELPEVQRFFVFPHMGDGGLALGAAMAAAYTRQGVSSYNFGDVYLGPDYETQEIIEACNSLPGLRAHVGADVVQQALERILNNEVVMWVQGRMEYGPRALGHRSILARADSVQIKDKLNLALKRRVWYQPFCPSMLESAARELLEAYNGDPNPFMTCAYRLKPEQASKVQGVINVDNTCRPQIIKEQDPSRYGDLLRRMKDKTGLGVLLNTSFNIHGEPLVCSPQDALKTFMQTEVSCLIVNDVLVLKSN